MKNAKFKIKNERLDGMVDVGGDIRVFGTPPNDREYWLVGLQDPQEESRSKDKVQTKTKDESETKKENKVEK